MTFHSQIHNIGLGLAVTGQPLLLGEFVGSPLTATALPDFPRSYGIDLTDVEPCDSVMYFLNGSTYLSTDDKVSWNGDSLDTLATVAKPGDSMDMVDEPNAVAVTALQAGLATSAGLAAGLTAATTAMAAAVVAATGTVTVQAFASNAINQLSARITIVSQASITPTRLITITTGDEYSETMGNRIPLNFVGSFPDLTGWTAIIAVTRDGVTIEGPVEITSFSDSTIYTLGSLAKEDTIKLEAGDGTAQLRLRLGQGKWTILETPAVVRAGLVAT
jgi:hypothetical protein